jgi:hypothetical protein
MADNLKFKLSKEAEVQADPPYSRLKCFNPELGGNTFL